MKFNPNIITRSAYTFFNSLNKIDDIINFALENEFSHASLVDKNIMYGTMEFYNKAIANGLIPVIGLEIESEGVHAFLLAKNENGYKNLMKISSAIKLGTDFKSLINNENLIDVTSNNFKITSYKEATDIKTLELFSSIGGNDSLEDNLTHFSTTEDASLESIYKQIDIKIEKQSNILPEFDTTDGTNPIDYLETLLKKNLKTFLSKNKNLDQKLYLERTMYEFSVIREMGFESYFLIVADLVEYAKNENISVGPGRGSAPGSIISFLLDITTIDPIKNGLLFERFLNPDRISMPDIDIDFEDTRRDEVIRYMVSKYGEDHVAHIITFQTLRAKMSLKDVARKLGVPVSEVEKLTKQIKDTDTLSKAEKTKKIKLILDTNETLKDVFEKAKKIEGLPRQSSTHAAGIVLSKQSISDVVPLQEGYNGINQTQYAMNYLEENGLLKIDFLGLRNLTFIKETIKLIDKDIDIDNIDLNDKKALKLLANGSTGGIFQMESPGMTKVLRELKPTIFEDIIATTSLFRPGPIKSIPYYIKRKHGKEKVESIDPSIDSILEPTFGLIIYQEQIMKIAQEYAGLSLAEADSLRRAIGKKDSALMQSLVKEFKLGAATKGRNEDTTNKIIQFIEEFASYGFNRSHAFAYSIISMQLAWLKSYYPKEFMTSLLSSVSGNTAKTNSYINEAQKLGIEVKTVSINNSIKGFTLENNSIRIGFITIKGLGVSAANEIILEREENGNFKNFQDFVIRVHTKKVGQKTIELLIKAGAFDELGLNRNSLLENNQVMNRYCDLIKVKDGDGFKMNTSLIPVPTLVEKPSTSYIQFEIDSLGFALSKQDVVKVEGSIEIEELPDTQDTPVIVVGTITYINKIQTKAGLEMAFVTVADLTGKISITIWPGSMKKYESILIMGSTIIVEGKIDVKRNKSILPTIIKGVN